MEGKEECPISGDRDYPEYCGLAWERDAISPIQGGRDYPLLGVEYGPATRALRAARVRRKHHPKRAKAHRWVSYAVERAELVRPARCEACGRECKVIAHHEDYDKPLEVEWLCRACHAKRHPFPPVDNRNA